jgi:hypothetical protein
MFKKTTEGQVFIRKWEKRRNYRHMFMFLGFLYFGGIVGFLLFYLLTLVGLESFAWLAYARYAFGFGLLGIYFAWYYFRKNEKHYQHLLKWETETYDRLFA